ncbi:uncharacterized protein LOC130933633 [Arachis stenosperma]|uniref:uncharacterized protein LOC130933633 n=1 Tax=Arachis stenosperma TaxID=217475 RepID=UPI0025ABC728|nr:uncharacterized protein LOC130933633 [Arachis stenosperma]
MDSEKSLLVLVNCFGKIKKSNRHGVKFTDKEPLSIFIRLTDTLSDLKRNILQKAGLCGAKLVKKVFYKIPMAVVSSGVQYETFVIESDEDMEVLFHCRRNFSVVRIHELFAKLEDGVDTLAGRSPSLITSLVGSGEADHVEDAMRKDDSHDEPDHISGDSEEEILMAPPAPQGPSSSGSHQQPPQFPTLNLEAVSQQLDEVHIFGGQGLHEDNTSGKFQIGQSFQTKEEAVMSVKDYSIHRGVQYQVMESDHLKYVGRCKEFGNGCTWTIRMALRQRKGNREVRRYNGAHTYLATSISSDHRQLDYHIICARIYPLVRADAAVTIKVLQEATESTYGFRPSYRKVWKAKQKAVAQIYGNWEESYAELLRWILGMQATMDGTVALLKTSPVRVSDEVDESTEYFHRLFWTFSPCIEAFKHCKPLISIDGILVISDRHNGINTVLEAPDSGWLPPHAYRAYCIRQVAANFALSFKGHDGRRLLVNAAYAKTDEEFDYWFDIMRTENLAICDWANRLEYDKWTQHQNGGKRFSHMTTNIFECVNSVLKGTQNLPVTALVKSTYGRLAELFVVRGQIAEAQLGSGQRFCQALVKVIECNLKNSRCFLVTLFDRHQSEYTMAETIPTGNFSRGTYRVSLKDRTCDCMYF